MCFSSLLKEKSASDQRLESRSKNRTYNLGEQIGGWDELINYNALCRGERLLSHKALSQLKCWYDSRKQPYFYLMPIKIEQNSINPAIYTFYQVISDSEIEILKTLAISLVNWNIEIFTNVFFYF